MFPRGVQTLALFKTKIIHFATLLKTGDHISRPCFISLCVEDLVVFQTNCHRITIIFRQRLLVLQIKTAQR